MASSRISGQKRHPENGVPHNDSCKSQQLSSYHTTF
nr:MAG TPA: hypothetical protein [Caudoviricetes sp.]